MLNNPLSLACQPTTVEQEPRDGMECKVLFDSYNQCSLPVGRVLQPELYNPGGIVLSDILKIVPRNVEYFHLRVPHCRALPATRPHQDVACWISRDAMAGRPREVVESPKLFLLRLIGGDI